MPPKGGLKRRLGLDKASEPQHQSRMSKFCSRMALTGQLPAPEVGEAAAAAVELMGGSRGASSSSATPADLASMASVAPRPTAEGRVKKRGNASRTLWRSLNRHTEVPATYTAEVPVWDTQQMCRSSAPMTVLPIHELLSHLVETGGAESWCAATPSQQGFVNELQAWGVVWESMLPQAIGAQLAFGEILRHRSRRIVCTC